MKSARFRFDAELSTSAAALVGVVGGVAAVLIHNLLLGATDFNLIGIVLGSVLAGFLARRGSGSAKRAGIATGAIGSLLAFGAWSYPLRARFLDDGVLFSTLLIGIMLVVIVTWFAAIGAVGGFVGSWAAGNVASKSGSEAAR